MTDDSDQDRTGTGSGVPWDRFIRGAAVGSAVVLILFLVIAGTVYFTTDYEFATVSEPGAAPPITEPPSGTQPPSDLDGRAIVQRVGCVACHSTDGSILVGPSWQNLIGSEVTFEDGSSLIADAEYVRQSILDPTARVVEGFQPLMPQTYGDLLSGDEINAIVAYISSL